MDEQRVLGKYIYCIIESDHPQSFGPLGIGGRGDELYTIFFGDIAAVVSNSPIISYSVSRENMLTYERAIEEIMKKHTVLPVRFNTIAQDEDKVKKILEKEHVRCVDLLKNMEGKKELGIKAIFKEDIIYKEILETDKDIKRLKETIESKPPEQTRYQCMEIGKMVKQALDKEKEKYKEVMLDILKPLSDDVKINNTYGERMIINAAFLVREDKETDFDQKVNELAVKYGDKINFKYVGTVPPFNFVNLIIETGAY